ncbi:MAG: mannonate dehydratase [Hyphomicrobiales bacterium]
MKQTWRWFGPTDTTTVFDMLQAGVEGVVTSLHDIPSGSIWPEKQIKIRQNQIATRKDGKPSGLTWDVVDSLLGEEARRKAAHQADWEIAMRPDHAQELLGDIGRNSQTGYPFTGSLRDLAELRGVVAALDGSEFQSDWH